MTFSHQQLLNENSLLKAHLQAPGWVLAVSGGLDSMCLLHAFVLLQRDYACPPLRVVHINHGLQPQALQWQWDVENKCQAYGLVCASYKVTLCSQQERQLGLEAAARNARYKVFEQHLQEDELLLLAQHADDQSETLFLRLLRGAGVTGLQAMPQQRALGLGRLVRPLLKVRQTDLFSYAKAQHLSWCEDLSNQNHRFDRNYLRHQVLPLLRQRWPALEERVANVVALMGDTQALLNEVAVADFMQLHQNFQYGEGLPCAQLNQLSRPRRHNLLRYWLARHHLPMPDYGAMQAIDKDFLNSAIDSQPSLQLGAWWLRRHQGYLLLIPQANNSFGLAATWSYTIEASSVLSGCIVLPGGSFNLQSATQVGMALVPGDVLERRFRAGGERCKPSGRVHSQSLKKLLQEIKVPPWERDQLPLFYVNGKLAMVADLWVNSGFDTAPDSPAWCWQKQIKAPAFDCSD